MQSFSKFKRAICTLSFLCMATMLCTELEAQFSAGLEGGFNKNYLVTNNANRAFTNYNPMYGFSIGVPVQYKLNDWLVIAADPSFIQKNYEQDRSSFFAGIYEQSKNSYINLPLTAHFLFGGRRLKGFAEAGIYGAYWITGKVKGAMPDILDQGSSTSSGNVYDYDNIYKYNEKYAFDSRRDNRLEAGWVGGLGISYDINSRFQVFTAARLLYSFTDQQKNYETNQTPRYNSTYGMNAGVMMQLPCKKNKKNRTS
jgi:hypothetical protein